MQVVGRYRLQSPGADDDVHTIVGNGHKGICLASKMGHEALPQPAQVALYPGVELKPHRKRRNDIRVLMRCKNLVDPTRIEASADRRKDGGKYLAAARIEQKRVAIADHQVLVGIDQKIRAAAVANHGEPFVVAILLDGMCSLHATTSSGWFFVRFSKER